MKKSILSVAFLSAALAANAAVVDSVTASQQWPWSTDIKVTYVLSSVDAAVDLHVSAENGTTPLAVPAAAIRGETQGIKKAGEGTLTIDPKIAFGTDQVALADLKIAISVTDSKYDPDEAIYRIYDLDDGSCENVTRRDLLAGKWGAVATSYQAIDPNFTTDLEDVLIWTDVVNNPAYKTTKLVMRKIKAKDVVWRCGDPDDVVTNPNGCGRVGQRWVKLNYDYYISVFEVTRAQWKKLYGSLPTSSGLGDNDEYATYPACNMQHWEVNGHPGSDYASFNTIRCNEKLWFPKNTYVRDVGRQTLCAKLWDKTNVEFNMPTGAEWEFACRGGQSGVLYSGEAQTMANANKIAWNAYNSGNAQHAVGGLKPNAYGLYDMLGNVMEHTSYTGNLYDGGISGTGESEADPVLNPLGNPNPTFPGCSWYTVGGGYYNDWNFGGWQDMRPSDRCGWYPYYQTSVYVGTRLVCPTTEEWGAGWPTNIMEEPIVVESVKTLYLGDEKAAAAGSGKVDSKTLAYDGATTGDLLAKIDKGVLKAVNPETVELFIGYNNTLRPYADETPLDTVIGVREIATKLRKAYPNALIWLNPLTYDAVDSDAQKVRKYGINKACVEINEGNEGKMFLRQPDWMYVYPVSPNPWPSDCFATAQYISKYWLSNVSDPRLKKKLAEKRAHAVPAYDCVMVGDSVTHFWEGINGKGYFEQEIAPTWDVFNLGFGGDSTYHTIWNLLYSGLFDGYTSSVITVLMGNNNIGETSTDADLADVAKGCKRIIDILKANHPESKIVLFPLLPKGNQPGVFRTLHATYNDLIKEFADGTTVVWAGELWDNFLATADKDGVIPTDVLCDGSHPGTRGYQIFGEVLKKYLPKKD